MNASNRCQKSVVFDFEVRCFSCDWERCQMSKHRWPSSSGPLGSLQDPEWVPFLGLFYRVAMGHFGRLSGPNSKHGFPEMGPFSV